MTGSKIKPRSYVSLYCFGCCFNRTQARKYKQLLRESETKISKKLDIRRLIRDQLFLKAAMSVLLSKSQMKFIRHLGINANEIGYEDKPLKKKLSQAYGNEDTLLNVIPSYVAELALSDDQIDRRLYNFIISLGYKVGGLSELDLKRRSTRMLDVRHNKQALSIGQHDIIHEQSLVTDSSRQSKEPATIEPATVSIAEAQSSHLDIPKATSRYHSNSSSRDKVESVRDLLSASDILIITSERSSQQTETAHPEHPSKFHPAIEIEDQDEDILDLSQFNSEKFDQ